MPQLVKTDKYQKKEREFLKKNKHLYSQYKKTLYLLKENPKHPSLRLHKLKGALSEYFSLSINLQYRVLLYFIIIEDKIMLVSIGTHDEVY